MGGRVTFASWFLWVYAGTFIVLTAWAVWWLFDVVRRAPARFPAGWPSPKLRWGIVPAAWLFVVVAQTLIYFVGLALRQGVAAQGIIDRTNLGLATFALIALMLVVGVAYLLRVVFPSPGRLTGADEGDEGPGGSFVDDEPAEKSPADAGDTQNQR